MSRILPLRIQDQDIELYREEIIPILPSPIQSESLLKFTYSLYRRRDHERIGMVRGQLKGDTNRILSMECRMSEPAAHDQSYLSKALNALEGQVRKSGCLAPASRVEEYEDYEIYL